jgi:hypothetical protein
LIIRDYNGEGAWSAESIQGRYRAYARRLGVSEARDLSPLVHSEGDMRWIYPVMDKVIDGIEAHDPACIQLGIEFIEEDASFTFGRILKAKTARALRRAPLTREQAERIRERVVRMILRGYVPPEYGQYARLLRRIGLAEVWPRIEGNVDFDNKYVCRYYRYFETVMADEARERRT